MTINNISVFIPRVFSNITEERIIEAFENNRLAKVSNIDFIDKMDHKGNHYYSVYVHFEYWYDNIAAFNFQQKVLDPTVDAKLVYDDPWHWIVLENTSQKRVINGRKVCLNLTDYANTYEHTIEQQWQESKDNWLNSMSPEQLAYQAYLNTVVQYYASCQAAEFHQQQCELALDQYYEILETDEAFEKFAEDEITEDEAAFLEWAKEEISFDLELDQFNQQLEDGIQYAKEQAALDVDEQYISEYTQNGISVSANLLTREEAQLKLIYFKKLADYYKRAYIQTRELQHLTTVSIAEENVNRLQTEINSFVPV